MSIVRWEPELRLLSLRDAMDRLFEDSFISPRSAFSPFANAAPALDMYQTGDDVVVKATLPGVRANDLEISVTGEVLTVKGEMRQDEDANEEGYVRRERRFGSFARSIALPTMVDVDKAEARYEDGILTLILPKSEAVKPKTIKISNGHA
jgi:HSP20 family protein